MLQIKIVHSANAVKVTEIVKHDTLEVLASFDETKGKIDLSQLKDYINQKILISHYNTDEDGNVYFDYEHIKTIASVGTDDNGIMYLEYN